jgi:2-isopropylmalate synthase
VGKSAFATKAGIHASAIIKEPKTYEHVPPETVGNRRQMLVSDQAGKSNLLAELNRIGLKVAKDDSRLDDLLRSVKEREAQGYAYDGADASFELLARRALGTVPKYFDVISFRVIVEERDKEMISEAVVKVKVDGQIYLNAERAVTAADRGEKVLLVRVETSPEDLRGMIAAEGILTARGGVSSHAALVARQMGKVCV